MGGNAPAPIVVEHERESFDAMVNFYFPGEERFICNPYEWHIRIWMRQQPKHERVLTLFSSDEPSNGGTTFQPVPAVSIFPHS